MQRRSFVAVVTAALASAATRVHAQALGSIPRIGYLNNLNPRLAGPSTEAFLEGLRQLGWVDGKNLAIEYRWADGDMARHAGLAGDLVKARVAIIVTAGTQAVKAALLATRTIPIVVAIMPDPVALGFAASLARPGGNVTGVANLFEELTPKQLQIFREVFPGAKRIALLSDRSIGDSIQSATESAAREAGLSARVLYASDAAALDAALHAAGAEHVDGLLVLPSPMFNRFRARIGEMTRKARLPTFSESSEYVRDGGLLSYGPNFPSMYFAAASYVDRILKGAKPGDLPIERPKKFELAVNLQTAKLLGITVPQSVLLRADEVVP